MKQSLIVFAAFLCGCAFFAAVNPLPQATAQERPQIRVSPKSAYENVLSGDNIWMFDSATNQVIGCRFGGSAIAKITCDKAKLP
jgi:ABC-type molybdate transport system substrate-binding protein